MYVMEISFISVPSMKRPYLQGIVVSIGNVLENRFSHLVAGYKTYLLKELCESSETIKKTYRNNMGGNPWPYSL